MGKKLTTEEFIERAKKIHGDKYDYSKVEYVNASTKVCIICPEHGEFWQTPSSHLNGNGCIDCVKKRQYTTKSFIEKAKQIHGDKYNYDKVEYKNNKTKVLIKCNKCGNEFWQRPDKHLQGKRCPICYGSKKLTYTEFVNKANYIHKNKYDYSKVKYTNNETKVCIICPEHGEFWQTPHAHLSGQGCPICAGTKKLTAKIFIERAKKIHKNKYDYSKVKYTNNETKVCIICPEHGEFWQTPHAHLSGQGCPICGGCLKSNTDEFIGHSKKIHGDKYDYSKVNYINTDTKVCIICPEHGEFWQTPHNHLKGQGCPYCLNSKLENKAKLFLTEKNISFIQEKTFDWLKYKGNMYLDFYLPKYNVAIECQGIQHFKPIDFFGGIDGFISRTKLDYLKFKLCNEHNIKIFYFSEIKNEEYFSKIYTNLKKIIKEIKNE